MNNQLLASDNFASGSLAAGWSPILTLSACQVVAGSPNVTEPNVAGTAAGQVWTGLTWPNDQCSEVIINNLVSSDTSGATQVVLHVRKNNSTGAGYLAQIHSSGAATCTLSVFKFDGTTLTQLGVDVTTLTVPSGSILAFQVAGACLAVYLNFIRIFYVGDATYASGVPGFQQLVQSGQPLSHSQVSSWRGYSGVQQDGIWTKQGVVLVPASGDLTGTPAVGTGVSGFEGVRFEGGAKILSGNVYKGYFLSPAGINYAESSDGINWTKYASNPVIAGYAAADVYKNGGTYYLWAQINTASGSGPGFLFTSTDGVTWAGPTATNLAPGSGGAWDNPTAYFGMHIIDVVGGLFYGLYSALNGSGSRASTGLATSPDGITWTKYVGNPVVVGAFCGTQISKINGVYYAWMNANQPGQGNPTAPGFDPLETVLYSSTNLTTWTLVRHSIHRFGMWESLNSSEAGVYTGAVIQIGNRVGMYYVGSPGDSTPPAVYQGGLALAPIGSTLAALVANPEDGTVQVSADNFQRGTGGLGGNWTTLTGKVAPQIASSGIVEPNSQVNGSVAYYSGATFKNDQYSEVTLQAAATTSDIELIVRAQPGVQTFYDAVIVQAATGVITSITLAKIVGGANTTLLSSNAVRSTPQIGDLFRFSVTTGNDGFPILTLFQNGFTIAQVQDYSNAIPSGGFPGIALFDSSANANAQISSWAGGNANVLPSFSTAYSWIGVDLNNSHCGLRH